MALTKVTGQVIKNTTDVTVGVLTVTNTLAVGGTVSIGGTLTYEDVTNIDSVGLITARNGIIVGSGITLSKDGDIFATGVTTSTTFSGNFSGGTVSGTTGTFTGDVDIADKIVHTGDTNTAIRFPAADTFSVETAGNEAARINSDGKILIGSTAIRNIGGASASSHIQLEGLTANTSSLALINNQANTNCPVFSFGKTRGTSDGAVTTVADGDNLGEIEFCGADGTDLENATAQIRALVNGTVSGNTVPTDLIFETSPSNNTNRSERLRIASDGDLVISGNSTTKNIEYGDGTTTGYFVSNTNVNRASADAAIHSHQFRWNNTKVAEIKVITGSDTTNKDNAHITFETASAGTTAERLRIHSSGIVLVGATASRSVSSRIANLQVQGTTGGGSALSITRNSGNSSGPSIDFAKTRAGSLTDNTIVNNGDLLGNITFSGGDGTDTASTAARIRCEVDGTPGSDDMPGRLTFETTADGAASPTERLRIDSDGLVTLFNGGSNQASEFNAGANQFVITHNGNCGLTIDATSSTSSSIHFADGASGNESYRGIIEYDHSIDAMKLFTAATVRLKIDSSGHTLPGANNSYNLGSSSSRWANVYTNDLHLSNQGSTNSVDNTWGDFTIQEGETDLYLINNRSGKKYKFNLTEVL